MTISKDDWTRAYLENLESQVQFGDTKASLLVASDTFLIAVVGALIKAVSGCAKDAAIPSCIQPSPQLWSALTSASFLVLSLACALGAALPAAIHLRPKRQFFLSSYVGGMKQEEFSKWYSDASDDTLLDDAVLAMWGKAKYASRKFQWLWVAIVMALCGVASLVATAVLALQRS